MTNYALSYIMIVCIKHLCMIGVWKVKVMRMVKNFKNKIKERWREITVGDGEIFKSYPDNFFYLLLSALYPVIAYFSNSLIITVDDKTSIYSYLLTSVLFASNFFYDYYNRYGECDGSGYSIGAIKMLAWGRKIFAGLVLFTLFILFCFHEDWLVVDNIKLVMRFVGIVGLYPTLMAVLELHKRSRREKEQKIKNARI